MPRISNITQEDAEQRFLAVGFKLDDFYKNKRTKVWVICLNCERRFKILPGNALYKDKPYCRFCVNNLTQEEVELRFLQKGFELIDNYVNNNTKVKAICLYNDCGKEISVTPNNILSGAVTSCGCRRNHTQEDMESFFLEKELKLVGKYINTYTRVETICLHKSPDGVICNKTFYAMPSSVLNGSTKSCGCYHIELCKSKVGPLNHNWKPELTEEERESGRLLLGYLEWKFKVKEMAEFTCENCKDDRGGNLVSHHKDGWNWCKERRFDLTNGACLCDLCHIGLHRIYGFRDNTEAQYNEFRSIFDFYRITTQLDTDIILNSMIRDK